MPDDIQHLAYETYVAAIETIDDRDVDVGLQNTIAHEATLHAHTYERLALAQRKILTALAHESTNKPYSGGFVRRAGVSSPSAAQRAVGALETAELITEHNGTWQVTSPFFAGWLRKLA